MNTFTDLDLRNMSDSEYLHYCSLGMVPGVDASVVDALVVDCLDSGRGLKQARRFLVEKQTHSSDVDKILAVQRCA